MVLCTVKTQLPKACCNLVRPVRLQKGKERKLLVTKGIATRSKKLLGAPGLATRSKKLLATKGIATSNKKLLGTRSLSIKRMHILERSRQPFYAHWFA